MILSWLPAVILNVRFNHLLYSRRTKKEKQEKKILPAYKMNTEAPESPFLSEIKILLGRRNGRVKDLAEDLGLTRGYLSNVLHGKKEPSPALKNFVSVLNALEETRSQNKKPFRGLVLTSKTDLGTCEQKKDSEINDSMWFSKVSPASSVSSGSEIDTLLKAANILEQWIIASNKSPEIKGAFVGKVHTHFPISELNKLSENLGIDP